MTLAQGQAHYEQASPTLLASTPSELPPAKRRNYPPIGQVFGELTVIGEVRLPCGNISWVCRCQCGEEVNRQPSDLRNGKYLRCRDCVAGIIAGQQFGLFRVVAKISSSRRGAIWQVRCECGTEENWITYRLRATKNPMCGNCAAVGRGKWNMTHGASQDKTLRPIYNRWKSMWDRCTNPSHPAYKWYGAKGITVCSLWQDFREFEVWAKKNGFQQHLEIDRIDEDGGYSPDNCQFIPKRANVLKMLAKHRKAGTGVFGGKNAAA